LKFVHLIITGEARSGTTLVANFLNSQQNCVVYSDLLSGWFRELRKLGLKSLLTELDEREKNVLLTNMIADGWRLGVSDFDAIERTQFLTPLELIQLAFKKLDHQGDSKLVGSKITGLYGYTNELLEHNFKMIFCVRDPRDVLISAKNRFSEYNMYHRAIQWRESVMHLKENQGHPGFYCLKFENLLEPTEREGEIAKLSDYLGISLDHNPDQVAIRNGIEFLSNTSFGDVNQLFDPNALYRWRNDTSSNEVIFASKYLENELEYFNYQEYKPDRREYRKLHRLYFVNRFKYWLIRLAKRIYYLLLK
jgi:hypothetical protein